MIYDYIVIGSGFGGSVASLRLVEKGYKVLLLEQGKRFNPEDFPKTNWNIPKYLWIPALEVLWISETFILFYCKYIEWNRSWRRKSGLCQYPVYSS
jgi:cholesterol oxidase